MYPAKLIEYYENPRESLGKSKGIGRAYNHPQTYLFVRNVTHIMKVKDQHRETLWKIWFFAVEKGFLGVGPTGLRLLWGWLK